MLHLLNHPLGKHVVTHLQEPNDKRQATFRTLAYQISLLLALEATRNLATRDHHPQLPLEPHAGSRSCSTDRRGADFPGWNLHGPAFHGFAPGRQRWLHRSRTQ